MNTKILHDLEYLKMINKVIANNLEVTKKQQLNPADTWEQLKASNYLSHKRLQQVNS